MRISRTICVCSHIMSESIVARYAIHQAGVIHADMSCRRSRNKRQTPRPSVSTAYAQASVNIEPGRKVDKSMIKTRKADNKQYKPSVENIPVFHAMKTENIYITLGILECKIDIANIHRAPHYFGYL